MSVGSSSRAPTFWRGQYSHPLKLSLGYSRGDININSNWRTVPKQVLNAPNLPLGVCDMEFKPCADLGALAQQ
jgi:hypothetical protein